MAEKVYRLFGWRRVVTAFDIEIGRYLGREARVGDESDEWSLSVDMHANPVEVCYRRFRLDGEEIGRCRVCAGKEGADRPVVEVGVFLGWDVKERSWERVELAGSALEGLWALEAAREAGGGTVFGVEGVDVGVRRVGNSAGMLGDRSVRLVGNGGLVDFGESGARPMDPYGNERYAPRARIGSVVESEAKVIGVDFEWRKKRHSPTWRMLTVDVSGVDGDGVFDPFADAVEKRGWCAVRFGGWKFAAFEQEAVVRAGRMRVGYAAALSPCGFVTLGTVLRDEDGDGGGVSAELLAFGPSPIHYGTRKHDLEGLRWWLTDCWIQTEARMRVSFAAERLLLFLKDNPGVWHEAPVQAGAAEECVGRAAGDEGGEGAPGEVRGVGD